MVAGYWRVNSLYFSSSNYFEEKRFGEATNVYNVIHGHQKKD